MLRLSVLTLVFIALSTLASANTARPAKPGESCASLYGACTTQCSAVKQSKGQQACNSDCLDNRATCQKTGSWFMPKTKVRINKLPPQ
ncbi:MAG: hypothetical protein KIT25_23495 [Enhydrobacter sp.]|nr:MAG: hypothetical protein KIT25_23495 [Enhydrobacter sp.]